MRRMSFSLSEHQLVDGAQTVTWRLGWQSLHAGDELLAVHQGLGRTKGDRLRVLCRIRIIDVRIAPIAHAALPGETARAGFPELTGAEFVLFFCRSRNCGPLRLVTRIEFVRLPDFPGFRGAQALPSSTYRYTTKGRLHGRCGHLHENLQSAVSCLAAHEALCIARGGHTDRKLFLIDAGTKQELHAERAAVPSSAMAPSRK